MNVSFKETTYGRDGKPIIVEVLADGIKVGHLLRSQGVWMATEALAKTCMSNPAALDLVDAKEAVKTALAHTVETLDRAFGKALGTNDAQS